MSQERHPPGLYVLFFTEMWERFGFYSMVAMFTIYLQDKDQGLGWPEVDATNLYANYAMFVYASPLLGGLIADRGLGFRRSVLIGGLIFMIGYALLAIRSETAVYAALTCLVIGNGFFKPNVSAMVGRLYPEGSPLKDRAYNIFYMGINIGALAAPLIAGFMVHHHGFHPAFLVASAGMIVSVAILWTCQRYTEPPQVAPGTARLQAASAMDAVPEWKRIAALIVIFLVVIVFWMVFHQNGSTLTYWAKDNTVWAIPGLLSEPPDEIRGIVSNAINPFWVITLTFPVVWLWHWLSTRGLEPSTPTKMAIGMLLTAVSFFVLYWSALQGEATLPEGVTGTDRYHFKVSIAWLVVAYAIVTLGELMLSPMGLSLVSKVAPERMRGLMMGGWFVATAIGNKLVMIGVFWKEWLHSTFFLVLGSMALFMAVVLFLLLRPLKKAMPGV